MFLLSVDGPGGNAGTAYRLTLKDFFAGSIRFAVVNPISLHTAGFLVDCGPTKLSWTLNIEPVRGRNRPVPIARILDGAFLLFSPCCL
jgi:hypothetical protein